MRAIWLYQELDLVSIIFSVCCPGTGGCVAFRFGYSSRIEYIRLIDEVYIINSNLVLIGWQEVKTGF